MQKIVPHLWFNRDGAAAAERYVSLFPKSRITSRSTISDTPSGTVETLSISLAGQDFALLSAGPEFKFTPAVSFLVACETKAEVDRLRSRLLEGGSELMPLDAYPFSERYAWVVDGFGLSWQLMYNGGAAIGQRITPTLMFTGKQCGKAEEAVSFYASLFGMARIEHVLRYGPGEEPNGKDLVKHAAFSLEGQDFAAMDSALDHGSTFNEAISFMVYCDDQAEIDRYWGKLSAACGGRAVRLAQGPLRPFLADRAAGPGPVDGLGRPRAARARDDRLPQDEEARHRRARKRIRQLASLGGGPDY